MRQTADVLQVIDARTTEAGGRHQALRNPTVFGLTPDTVEPDLDPDGLPPIGTYLTRGRAYYASVYLPHKFF